MGGPLTFRTAASAPERVGAAATFHGGGLVTDKPDSPHLLIPKMKAEILCAVADNDDKRDPSAKDKLKESFAAAHLKATVEVYQGCNHGWTVRGSQVYNEVSVPERSLHFGPWTSVTTPLRSKGLGFGSLMLLHFEICQQSRP